MNDILLEVKNLKTYFDTYEGTVRAVDGVSFVLRKGETLGLVGESGCGKSVTALSIMHLIPRPPGRYVGGEVFFEGRNLMELPPKEMRLVRGKRIGMIFQEPTTSLNPVHRIGYQIAEPLMVVERTPKREAWHRAVDMLERVRIGSAVERARQYPHQLSGGMKQRAMIAMALVRNPALLIADEPTTALDVTIQAQILELMKELQESYRMSVLLITHNLGVVAEMAHHVCVMYAGRIVEFAPTLEVFTSPAHPYTQNLLACIPSVKGPRVKLAAIHGQVPNLISLPPGCRFQSRCLDAGPECAGEEPELREVAPNHYVACYKA
jgi:oligopeptide/dipeptide ABC transporter ATP-binding protein